MNTNAAPVIRMNRLEHYQTGSHGHQGLRGVEWRAGQQQLVNAGRYDDALKMGIEDVRSIFGNKYDSAIEEMLNAFPKTVDGLIDWSKIKRKK